MFNRAQNWSQFLKNARDTILARLPEKPVVVEIGHGDGGFLAGLAEARPAGRFIGFDPHGTNHRGAGTEFRQELFEPGQHMPELKPDLIISRHVLEHLVNPLGFLQRVAFEASDKNLPVLAYLEVPCIDQAIETGRTVDFYYEHSSQFTTQSFSRMLALTTHEVLELGHGYNREVVYAFARLGVSSAALHVADEAGNFRAHAEAAKGAVVQQLDAFHKAGTQLAIWGGTGKGAAFMCRHGVDRQRFPIVVDSDQDKVGTFVPGTGQEILFRDYLFKHRVDAIIIPAQWRAADIVAEMASLGIKVDLVLIEHQGRLIDFNREQNPYRADRK
jgi:hypothetical protein